MMDPQEKPRNTQETTAIEWVLCSPYVTTAFPLRYFAFLWIEDLGLTNKDGFVIDF